jgi:hypothetical protein
MEIREIKSTRIEIDSCTFQNCITPCAQTSDSASLMKVVASQVLRVGQNRREAKATRRTRTKKALTRGWRLYDGL